MQPLCNSLKNTYPRINLGRKRSPSPFQTFWGHVFLEHPRYSQIRVNHSQGNARLSGSAKLFADAVKEEEEQAQAKIDETSPKSSALQQHQHENWTGDESVQDAVLRMLMDKYKPLRTGSGIQSADQKLKKDPPKVSLHGSMSLPFEDQGNAGTSPKLEPTTTGSWASEPLLPSSEGHQPWHTEFKAPKHDSPAIRLAHSMTSTKPSIAPLLPLDERARRAEKEKRKRTQQVTKLADVRESTLDYRLGIRNAAGRMSGGITPTSLKGWANLVEDRIAKARKEGMFSTIQGRGKPLPRSPAEHNPFIAREEFLMNRIIQRNGAAPPWVEIQNELESAVSKFRQILRESWTRRAIRVISSESFPLSTTPSLQKIKGHRDPEWLEKEKKYHETVIKELNELVRKYNGVAPYSVRRPLYTRESEVERMYVESLEDISKGLEERGRALSVGAGTSGGEGGRGGGRGGQRAVLDGPKTRRFRDFLAWVLDVVRRWFSVPI